MTAPSSTAGRVILEALRLDLEPESAVRERARRAIELGAGGFIVFGGEADQVSRLISDVRFAAPYSLWIGADLERGVGQQFSGFPTLPPPAGLAAHRDPITAATQAGRLTGRAARELGIDLVFAPVLDLDIEPDNPIIGTRAFSGDPETVALLGAAWIAGCQGQGVLACAKHFPGHGRTVTDSHAEIPVIEASRTELEADLWPFRQVADTVAAMMADHVRYPALGADLPATMSPEVLTGLLRGELGFEGLIVTDAMNMSGFLDADTGSRHPAIGALLAGCDLLLYPDDLEVAVTALREAADRESAVRRRVAAALACAEVARSRIATDPVEDTGPIGMTPVQVALGCVTWSVNRPAWLSPDQPLRVIPVWDDREQPGRPEFGAGFKDRLRQAGWNVDSEHDDAPVLVLVASTPQAWKGTAGLTHNALQATNNALQASSARALAIVFGHSRLAEQLGGGICAWGTEPAMERAAAQAIIDSAREAG